MSSRCGLPPPLVRLMANRACALSHNSSHLARRAPLSGPEPLFGTGTATGGGVRS